ncbi:MAG: octaprenyl diphosphate synthase [Burkholderiales bacterium]
MSPLEAIRAAVAEDMRAVDESIRHHLRSEVVLIRQVAEYIVQSGGKRLRPALLCLSARAHGYQGSHHHALAAVVEFIHTATLLHDDVVDASEMRRGRATANALFGNEASVLVGDFLYSRSFQMMTSVRNMRVLEVLADATNVIAEGEVLQLLNCHNPEIDEDGYLRVIRYKTAKLFEAASRIGAILGGVEGAREDAAARYGMHLGTAFQLIDDVLDYSGDLVTTGKNLGDDLAEGKPTLPLIRAMACGTPQQSALIRAAIESGGSGEFGPVAEVIRDTGALDYARALAQEEARRACDAIGGLPHSSFKDSLLQLTDFAVARSF